MGWLKRPEEKKDEGQSKAEADALIDRLGTSLEERFAKKFESVDKLLSKWETAEAEATKQVNDEAAKAAEANATPEEKAATKERALFLLNVQTNARLTEAECIAEAAGRWPQIIPELKKVFASIQVERKAAADYPGQCRNVVSMLVGREAEKAGGRFDTNSNKFFLEDSVARTGGDDSPFNDPELTWVDDRNPNKPPLTASDQLAKLRIDPETFAKFVKQGGRGIVQ
jgi:hypothetical protein